MESSPLDRTRTPRLIVLTSLLIAGLLPGVAAAGDGVIEINLATAQAGLPGDAPGYPVTITRPGSYRLVGNLEQQVPSGGTATDVVQILAADVTLDLSGFRIECHRTTLPPTPCSGLDGLATGIVVQGENVAIRNGTIRGMPADGIDASFAGAVDLTVENRRSLGNGGDGLSIGTDARVVDSSFRDNADVGLRAVGGGHVMIGVKTRGNQVGLSIGANIAMGETSVRDGFTGSTGPVVALSCSYLGTDTVLLPICP